MMLMNATSKISEKEVEHIANLARIELTEEEKRSFTEQFNTILEYFEIINDLDTEDVPPTSHVIDVTKAFREDQVSPSLAMEDALKNASKKERGFFKAPKII
jgi:aspartyl-tRNA(Asn)/glutamyl-tRNA(Gln) amidotransferase subunit C